MTAASTRRPAAAPASRWLSRPLFYAGLLVLASSLTALYLLAVAASTVLLAESAEPEPVDTILVLGGDGPPRAAKASELWRAGLARNAIVAGDGDCLYIRADMVRAGVPERAIAVECLSGNTWTNALYSAPLLEASGTRSALLVTSWFHTGRALRTLRRVCPGIRWIPAATEPPPSLLRTAIGPYGPAVLKEYGKTAAYRLREWLSPPRTPEAGHACV